MSTPRQQLDLCRNWEFVRAPVGRAWARAQPQACAAPIHLPHSWNADDTFEEGVIHYRGAGAYRRTFDCPPLRQTDRAWLCAEGFYGVGDVWLNGHRLDRINGQYLGFRLPVGGRLAPGASNRLAIRLTNRCSPWILPGIRDPDFILFGGLAGRVWLEWTHQTHLDADRVLVHPRAAPAGDDFSVETTARAVNSGAHTSAIRLIWTLTSDQGTLIDRQASAPLRLAPGAAADLTVCLRVPAARRWSPSHPCLYTLRAELMVNDQPGDALVRRIGLRTAEFRPDAGFLLNGERLPLRGCNRHECLPGLGNALPPALHRADARAIHDMGLNFVRLSHYPQHPAFLDACDELGLLVYAELASWKSVRGGLWLRRALRQFEAMIRRDHHHPSIILWGMGNEARHRHAYRRLLAQARALDPDRPVTYAENHWHRARRAGTLGLPDVWGCNYELDRLAEGRDAARLRSVVVSECSNAPHTERGDPDAERAQIAQLAADLPRIENTPFAAGFALWSFNDYPTLRKRRYRRHCGLVDAWREPKSVAAWLRARYGTQPFVKLATDWSEEPARGAVRRVDVFCSCAPVEVRVNGRPVFTATTRGHHVLETPFEPGWIEAVAVPAETPRDLIESFGPAARLTLAPGGSPPTDPAWLRLCVCDASGRRVRDWRGEVAIQTHGAVKALTYRPRRVFVSGGLARIYLDGGANGNDGGECEAVAPGLATARLRVP